MDSESQKKSGQRITKKNRDLLLSSPKSIIIFSGEYPIYIDGKFYNNSEGNFRREKYHLYFQSKDNKTTFEENFINSINELLNYGHKVILHYPLPQLGWDPKRKIFYNNLFSKEIDLSIASIEPNKAPTDPAPCLSLKVLPITLPISPPTAISVKLVVCLR